MDVQELLIDVFGRVTEHVHEVLDGLDAANLSTVVVAGSNPIGWLVWHLARVEDSQVAELAGTTQIWASGNWAQRFGLEPDPDNHGYGHTPDDVAAVQPQDVAALADYYAAVAEVTRGVLGRISAADLDRVVDDRWDPPVTMGVRLVSVADDQIQHAGQAAYLRGLLERR